MESAQEARAAAVSRLPSEVSILVVMESAQEDLRSMGLRISSNRFNPCCNGKCSGRWFGSPRRDRTGWFQSLL